MTPAYHEAPPLSPPDLIRHLWRRLPVLLIGGMLAAGIGLGYGKFVAKSEYRSSAMLMVRTPQGKLQEGERLAEMDPPVYEDIFTTDEVIFGVLSKARERFPAFPKQRWESMRARFTVQSLMTRDTAVQAVYSPVLQLSTKWSDPEIAKFLMDEWLAALQERFSTLRSHEATSVEVAMAKYMGELNERMGGLLEAQGAAEQELSLLAVQIGADSRAVGGADGVPGLAQEIMRLELERVGAEGSGRDRAVQQLTRAKELRVEAEKRLQEQTARRAELVAAAELTRAEVALLRAQMGKIRNIVETVTPDIPAALDPLTGGEGRGDWLVLSRPVPAEGNVGISKALLAVAIAALLSTALFILVVAEFYIRWALAPEEK